MTIQQITAFLENRPQALLELLERLGQAEIDLYALSMAETRDYGALRLIVSDHDKALGVLADAGIPVKEVPVLAAQIEDHAGSLAHVVRALAQRGIDIHYCYAFFTQQRDQAWVILRVADPSFAASVLVEHGVRVLTEESLEDLCAGPGAVSGPAAGARGERSKVDGA